MATIQLTFNLRTPSNCKTVHLLGNWDGYKGQLPLSKESSKSGAWRGSFRFNGNLQQGQRYWYYYIIDGYSVSHDPAQPFTVEPTTQRKLNILDIPSAAGSKPALTVRTSTTSHRHSRRESAHIPHGRSLSPSKIVSPRPQKPHEARRLANKRYSGKDMDDLVSKMSRTQVSASSFSSSEDDSDSEIDSDASSDIPSLSSGSSRASPASSLVSPISPAGSPYAFGAAKAGSRCASSDASSDSEGEYYRTKLVSRSGAEKRHGIAVRHSRR